MTKTFILPSSRTWVQHETEALIDEDRLAAIAQDSSLPRAHILAGFRVATTKDAEQLRLACQAGDFPNVSLLAHRIKGACMILGATRLAEACSLLAMAGEACDTSQADAAFSFFERELELMNALLDLRPAAAAAPPVAAADASLCEGLHILVAEDHDFQRNIITRLLLRVGTQAVSGAADGAAALEIIADGSQTVDILVLDLSMPGMDGFEIMRRLGAAKSPVALILNTAASPSLLNSIVHLALGYNVHILGALSKPLTAAKLKPLVDAYRAGLTKSSLVELPTDIH